MYWKTDISLKFLSILVLAVLSGCMVFHGVAEAQIYSNYSLVTFIQGEVMVMTKSAAKWTPAYKGQRLSIGDKIKTGRSGRAEVKFANSAIFRMRPLSQLEIPSEKGNEGKRVGFLDMKFGKVWSKVKPVGKGESFKVRTPTAVAGIRGTVFTLSVNAITKKSIVAVLEGSIDVAAGGTTVPVGQNQKTSVEENQAPDTPEQMDPEEAEQENEQFQDNTFGNTTDTTPPNINLTSPASDEDIEDGKTTVAGSVDDPDATVTITVNGESQTVTVGGDGKFELEVTLKEGEENSIKVAAKDETGNAQEMEMKLTLKKKEYKIEVAASLEAGDDDEKKNDLKVTVTDQDGEAVSGAEVTVGEATATTNDSGEAVFKDLEPGNYKIAAKATFDDEEIEGSAEIEVEKTDEEFTCTVMATVEAADDDEKKNDIKVSLSDLSADLSSYIESNAIALFLGDTGIGGWDGSADVSVKDLAPGTYKVSAMIDDITVGSVEIEVEEEKIEYKIEATAMVSDGDGDGNKNDVVVTVKDQDGEAVEGASVKVGDYSLSSKSDGTCAVGNLEPGDYKVEATAEFDGEEVSGGAEFTIEEKEEEFSITVSATLEDGDGDGEANDAKVSIQDQNGEAPDGSEVNVDGTFYKSITEGELTVKDLKPGAHTISVTGYQIEDGNIKAKASGEAKVEVEEEKIDYSLSVMATAADEDGDGKSNDVKVTVQDQDSNAVASARVESDKTESGASASATTNASGEAVLKDLSPGDHPITVTAEFDGEEVVGDASITIEKSAIEYSLSLLVMVDDLNNYGGKNDVTCTVTDQDGSKVSGAAIVYQGGSVATTDGNGVAVLEDMKVGEHKIRARAKMGDEQKTVWSEEATAIVEKPGTLELMVTAGVDDKDGDDFKNDVSGTVSYAGEGQDGLEVTCGDFSATTKGDGSFEFKDLDPGTYQIRAEGTYVGLPAAGNVEVTVEKPETITITLRAMLQATDDKGGMNDVSGSVTDHKGREVPDIGVLVDGTAVTKTGSDGAFGIANLKPGSHGISAAGTYRKQEVKSAVVTVDVEQITVGLRAMAQDADGEGGINDIVGQVSNNKGEGVSGLAIIISGAPRAQTGSNGGFKVLNLDPDTYNVLASGTYMGEKVDIEPVSVEIGAPMAPSGGSISVDPPQGTANYTEFTARAANWESDAPPLTYQFFAGSTAFSSASDQDTATFKLSAGTHSVSVKVTDKYGTSATSSPAIVSAVGPGDIRMLPIMVEDLAGDSIPNDIKVTVQDDTGTGISGAAVKGNGKSATTGSDGIATLRNLDEGTHTISAEVDRYNVTKTTSQSVQVKVELSMLPLMSADLAGDTIPNDVKVTVQNGIGQGIPGAAVSGNNKRGSTGSDGTVVLRQLDQGSHAVTAQIMVGSKQKSIKSTVDINVEISIMPPLMPEALDTDNISNDLPKITVQNNMGQGVSGAEVSAGNRKSTTGSDGTTALRDMELGTTKVIARVKVGNTEISTSADLEGEIGYADTMPPVVKLNPLQDMIIIMTKPAEGQELPEAKMYELEADVVMASGASARADIYVDGTKAQSAISISGGKIQCSVMMDKEPKVHKIIIEAWYEKIPVEGIISDNLGPVEYSIWVGSTEQAKRTVQGANVNVKQDTPLLKGNNSIILRAVDSNPSNKASDTVQLENIYRSENERYMDTSQPEVLNTLPLADSQIDEFTSPVPFQLGSDGSTAKIELNATLFDLASNIVSPVIVRVTPAGGTYREYNAPLQGNEIKQWIDVLNGVNTVVIIAKDKVENQTPSSPFKIYVELGKGRIEGRITDGVSGSGLRGAKVTAIGEKGAYSGITGSDGRYTIIDVPYGTYYVIVIRDNYLQGYVDGVQVPSRKSTSTEIEPNEALIDY